MQFYIATFLHFIAGADIKVAQKHISRIVNEDLWKHPLGPIDYTRVDELFPLDDHE
jgi:hypothetical protein